MNKKICLLVHTGNKGQWIWPHWYRYWIENVYKHNPIFDTVFLGETDSLYTSDITGDIQQWTTGNVPWSNGLIDYLAKHCNYEYIMYHHEDYFITSPIDNVKLSLLLNLCDNIGIELLKICGMWCGQLSDKHPHTPTNYGTGFTGIEPEYESVLWLYNNNCDYLVSHQPSIWSKDFLLSTLVTEESPWNHETRGTERLRARNVPIYAYRGIPPIQYHETVCRGKIRENCQHFFEGNE